MKEAQIFKATAGDKIETKYGHDEGGQKDQRPERTINLKRNMAAVKEAKKYQRPQRNKKQWCQPSLFLGTSDGNKESQKGRQGTLKEGKREPRGAKGSQRESKRNPPTDPKNKGVRL